MYQLLSLTVIYLLYSQPVWPYSRTYSTTLCTVIYLVVHIFDDEQNRTLHVCQAPVQSLQTGPVLPRAVGQSPGVDLHTGRQAACKLEGKHIIRLRSVRISILHISSFQNLDLFYVV